jgi:hypothetical protein
MVQRSFAGRVRWFGGFVPLRLLGVDCMTRVGSVDSSRLAPACIILTVDKEPLAILVIPYRLPSFRHSRWRWALSNISCWVPAYSAQASGSRFIPMEARSLTWFVSA